MAEYRDYDSYDDTAARRPLARQLVVLGIGFAVGMVLMGWVLINFGERLGIGDDAAAAPDPAGIAARDRATAPARRTSPLAGPGFAAPTADLPLDERLAAIETRVAQLGNNARSAVGNASRAEGLLVAFAARRALDRGVALGYMESLLRQRFGESDPRAVAVVISAARQPVTLDGLQARLEEIAPSLTGRAPDESWWDVIRREMSELFVLRQAGTPSPAPSDRLERAREKLAAGQVDSALAEVLRLPGQEAAAQWVGDARRYVAARNALDRIETAALIEPRIAARRERAAQGASDPAEEPSE